MSEPLKTNKDSLPTNKEQNPSSGQIPKKIPQDLQKPQEKSGQNSKALSVPDPNEIIKVLSILIYLIIYNHEY